MLYGQTHLTLNFGPVRKAKLTGNELCCKGVREKRTFRNKSMKDYSEILIRLQQPFGKR